MLWTSGQRVTLDALSLMMLAGVVSLGAEASTAFFVAAAILRLLPLISRIGGNASAVASAATRVHDWQQSLRLTLGQESDVRNGHGELSDTALSVAIDSTDARIKKPIEFNLAPGDWALVRGPSGVGKSSVARRDLWSVGWLSRIDLPLGSTMVRLLMRRSRLLFRRIYKDECLPRTRPR